MRTLLVPLDGSRLAEQALAYAEVLASRLEAKLLLVRIAELDDRREAYLTARDEEAHHAAGEYVGALAEEVSQRGVPARGVVRCGRAAAWILEEARLRQADLIVMTAHGMGCAGPAACGRVASEVLSRAQVPVLLVPTDPSRAVALLAQRQPRILVPLDGSLAAEEALVVAKALADRLDAELWLSTAYPRQEDASRRQMALTRIEALSYLAQLRLHLALEGYRARMEVRPGPPAEVIGEVYHHRDAALVVMATHSRIGRDWLPTGSVPSRLIGDGTMPLLLVRPRRFGWTNYLYLPSSDCRLELDGSGRALVWAALRALSQAIPDGEEDARNILRDLERTLLSSEG